MTEKQLRQKIVSIMEGWLGYSEANGKFKQIIDLYNTQKPLPRGYKLRYTDEWCAGTVTAAGIKAGLSDIILGECSCTKMIEKYKAKGRWMERDYYVPSPGDIIMYCWKDSKTNYTTTDCTAAPNHVGIVKTVSGQNMVIIEGNKGEAVAERNMTVNGRFIRGYCLPDYASKATAPAKKVASASGFNRSYAKTYTVTAASLNMRYGAGTDREVIKALPKCSKVTCYGYYTKVGATVWLLVKAEDGTVGFCSKKYLK